MRPFSRKPLPSRRTVLQGFATLLATGAARAVPNERQIRNDWLAAWRWMEGEARRRGWELTPLEIAPPASESEIRALEARHGVTVPAEIRRILATFSAKVAFGWRIPPIDTPFEGLNLPYAGGLGDIVWDLAHIDEEAIPNFAATRKGLADDDESEAPNRPQMWENQFPLVALPGEGDFLTIDVASPDGPRPVRYFASELDGIHGQIIAPDFPTFVTSYARLGCAGSEQNDWFRFLGKEDGERHYLDPDGEGAKHWRAWLARDADARDPNEPPRAVAAKTRADYALLEGAKDGSLWAVEAALASGAVPDCIDARMPNAEGLYDISYVTAMVEAVRHGNLAMVDRLRQAGAALDTRLLSVSEAIRSSTPAVVRWLLQRGARANGWTGDRYWPIHVLLAEYHKPPWHDEADILAMLEMLLDAGADPDARWDGGITMLMWVGPKAMTVLLEHGADPNVHDYEGKTALHRPRSAEAARLLIQHGAIVDAMSTPSYDLSSNDPAWAPGKTPYQAVLSFPDENYHAILDVLVAAGADRRHRDAEGRSMLWYCHTLDDMKRHVALGLDVKERMRNGATLLHALVYYFGGSLGRPDPLALATWLIAQGLDVNAAMTDGRTALHLAAERGDKDAIAAVLKLGADKTRRDAKGRLPVDLVRRSASEARDLLRV